MSDTDSHETPQSDDETNYFRDMAERNEQRRLQKIINDGYRDGADAGRRSVFQTDFDIGYSLGSQFGRQLGRKQGLAQAYAQIFGDDSQQRAANDLLLSQPKRAHCLVCTDAELLVKEVVDIRDMQAVQMSKCLDVLNNRYAHLEGYCAE